MVTVGYVYGAGNKSPSFAGSLDVITLDTCPGGRCRLTARDHSGFIEHVFDNSVLPSRGGSGFGGRRMVGANVASVRRREGDCPVPVALVSMLPASALRERLDVPGGRAPFPVFEPLAPLLPGGGLRRGSVVAVRGSTALLLALLAAATVQGVWAAVVGVGDLGVLAAAEAGVVVRRLALVPRPGPDPAPVVAALLDGVGLVALAGANRMSSGARRSLAARARQRGSVLLSLGRWPGADVELSCRAEAWHGAEAGHGWLRSREVVVCAVGRGAAARPRTVRLLLPGPGGAVAAVLADSAVSIRAVGSIRVVG